MARRCGTRYSGAGGGPHSPGSTALLSCPQAQPLAPCTQVALASLQEKYRLVFKISNMAPLLPKPTVNLPPKQESQPKDSCTSPSLQTGVCGLHLPPGSLHVQSVLPPHASTSQGAPCGWQIKLHFPSHHLPQLDSLSYQNRLLLSHAMQYPQGYSSRRKENISFSFFYFAERLMRLKSGWWGGTF